jgi:hypothetical protein
MKKERVCRQSFDQSYRGRYDPASVALITIEYEYSCCSLTLVETKVISPSPLVALGRLSRLDLT